MPADQNPQISGLRPVAHALEDLEEAHITSVDCDSRRAAIRGGEECAFLRFGSVSQSLHFLVSPATEHKVIPTRVEPSMTSGIRAKPDLAGPGEGTPGAVHFLAT